jgi:hypothetical protein
MNDYLLRFFGEDDAFISMLMSPAIPRVGEIVGLCLPCPKDAEPIRVTGTVAEVFYRFTEDSELDHIQIYLANVK